MPGYLPTDAKGINAMTNIHADFEPEVQILNQLENMGWDSEDLPGPGDLHDAISEAGYELRPTDK
jgi:hypothetical protein